MNFLGRLAGAYVDAVLNTFYPLKPEPSLWDLEAEALADREAEEDVAEPHKVLFGGKSGLLRDPDPNPLDQLVALVEDIRNLLQSSVAVVSLEATELPGGSVDLLPSPAAGPPNLDKADWYDLARAARAFGNGCPSQESWDALADKVDPYR